MKISDVSVVVHQRHLPPGMPLPPMHVAVLRIQTDEGLEGNTFITPPGPDVTDQLIGQVKPMLLGRDPLDIGAVWHDLWAKRRGMHSTVQGYVDVALWDLAGKAAGLPVHRLLGTVRNALTLNDVSAEVLTIVTGSLLLLSVLGPSVTARVREALRRGRGVDTPPTPTTT